MSEQLFLFIVNIDTERVKAIAFTHLFRFCSENSCRAFHKIGDGAVDGQRHLAVGIHRSSKAIIGQRENVNHRGPHLLRSNGFH